MNCEQLRENIYEYLDGSLAPASRLAAQEHLATCLTCREWVKREQRFAASFSRQLEQSVAPVALDAIAQRQLAAAMERILAAPRERPPAPFWRRLALPFALSAAILIGLAFDGYHFAAGLRPPVAMTSAPDREVLVHVSRSVPSYTFQRQGNFVIDALTSDTQIVDAQLLVKNEPLTKTE